MHKADFLLERFIHVILKGDACASRKLLTDACDAGESPQNILCDILWPAVECAQQLYKDRTFPPRLYNAAVRTLSRLVDHIAERLPKEPSTGRSVLIISALSEPEGLGAHLVASLAESHGWTVYFGGANLSLEEITFSIGQLNPDTLLIHASNNPDRSRDDLIAKLHRIRIWPKIQIAVVGNFAAPHQLADLLAATPLEILELMALCPEYRADPVPTSKSTTIELLTNETSSAHISTQAISRLISHYLRKFPPNPN